MPAAPLPPSRTPPDLWASAPLTSVAVVGAGLIGSSIAHALRQSALGVRVVAYDAHAPHAQDALARGLIDGVAPTLEAAVQGADLVVLAVPVLRTGPLLATVAAHLAAHALLVDTGSAKQLFARECQALPATVAQRTLPCHPIAGHVTSGPSQADARLMQGRLMVMTPLPQTAPSVQARLAALWQAIGFQVMTMTPQQHDDVYASLSHMPHVAAFALLHYLGRSPVAPALLAELGGNAIKDMTRHASANPHMWSDIFTANRDSILQALQGYRMSLDTLEHAIRQEPGAGLQALLAHIQDSHPSAWRNAGPASATATPAKDQKI